MKPTIPCQAAPLIPLLQPTRFCRGSAWLCSAVQRGGARQALRRGRATLTTAAEVAAEQQPPKQQQQKQKQQQQKGGGKKNEAKLVTPKSEDFSRYAAAAGVLSYG